MNRWTMLNLCIASVFVLTAGCADHGVAAAVNSYSTGEESKDALLEVDADAAPMSDDAVGSAPPMQQPSVSAPESPQAASDSPLDSEASQKISYADGQPERAGNSPQVGAGGGSSLRRGFPATDAPQITIKYAIPPPAQSETPAQQLQRTRELMSAFQELSNIIALQRPGNRFSAEAQRSELTIQLSADVKQYVDLLLAQAPKLNAIDPRQVRVILAKNHQLHFLSTETGWSIAATIAQRPETPFFIVVPSAREQRLVIRAERTALDQLLAFLEFVDGLIGDRRAASLADDELADLLIKYHSLRRTVGDQHPELINTRDLVEQLPSGDYPLLPTLLAKQLVASIVEREQLQFTKGADHPEVQQQTHRIDALVRMLERFPRMGANSETELASQLRPADLLTLDDGRSLFAVAGSQAPESRDSASAADADRANTASEESPAPAPMRNRPLRTRLFEMRFHGAKPGEAERAREVMSTLIHLAANEAPLKLNYFSLLNSEPVSGGFGGPPELHFFVSEDLVPCVEMALEQVRNNKGGGQEQVEILVTETFTLHHVSTDAVLAVLKWLSQQRSTSLLLVIANPETGEVIVKTSPGTMRLVQNAIRAFENFVSLPQLENVDLKTGQKRQTESLTAKIEKGASPDAERTAQSAAVLEETIEQFLQNAPVFGPLVEEARRRREPALGTGPLKSLMGSITSPPSEASPQNPYSGVGGMGGAKSFTEGWPDRTVPLDDPQLTPALEAAPYDLAPASPPLMKVTPVPRGQTPTPTLPDRTRELAEKARREQQQQAGPTMEASNPFADAGLEMAPAPSPARSELQQQVTKDFEQRQQQHRAELEALEQRLQKIRESIETRERNKQQIIHRRIEELLNPQLQWDSPQSKKTAPAAPVLAPSVERAS